MSYSFLTKIRILLFLLTVAALLGHPYVPLKRFNLLPENKVQIDLFSDEVQGGSSHVEWLDQAAYKFTCNIGIQKDGTYCGSGIKFFNDSNLPTGVNLTGYDDLVIDISYEGTDDRIMMFYRNSDEPITDFLSIQKNPYMYTFLDKVELNNSVIIGLSNFVMADWWLYQNYTHRAQIHYAINNIVEFGITTVGGAHQGVSTFHIKSFYAVGLWISKERLYFYILMVWLIFAFAEGIFRIWHLWKQKRQYAAHLLALEQDLKTLETDFKELESSAIHDTLTGVYNRAGLGKVLAQTAYADNNNIYVYVLDIDHFKKVNDTYGHDAGDIILKAFSARLASNLRDADSIARWGGEEFVIVACNQSQEGAFKMADKLRRVIADEPFDISLSNANNSTLLSITVSIGIARFMSNEDFDTAFKRADKGLYTAKRDGRNRAIFSSRL